MRFALLRRMRKQKSSGRQMKAFSCCRGLPIYDFHRVFQLSLTGVFAVAALSAATAPVVTMVSPIVPQQFQTITITGSGFGTMPAYNGNSSYIRITDLTSGWSAGNSESCGPIYGCPDPVTLAVSSWTDSQIIIIGFTQGYGQSQHTLKLGDHTELYVWNPQTDVGPATYENVVQATGGNTGTSSSCASGSGAAGTGSVCVTMVSPIVPQQFQTITITGSGFGTMQGYNGNSSYIRITDLTSGWSAGNSESCGPIYGCPDPVTLAVSSWTDSQIIIIGFTQGYGQSQHTLKLGDHTELYVWNPQTDVGPATYENVVQATGGNTGTSSSCASGSGAAGTGFVCVTMVSPIVPQQFQTITITGSGFGTMQGYNGNSSYIRITDLTSGWSAGNSESCGPIYGCPDPVTLAISTWTDSQIVVIGFTGGYGQGQYALNIGDHTELYIWNPQTDLGPATYENVVQAAASTLPLIESGGVVSASAFGEFTSAAAGTWIEIYGSNLASDTRSWTGADFNGNDAPTSLDGTSVTIAGQLGFVDYISPTQVNALIPSNVPTGQQQTHHHHPCRN